MANAAVSGWRRRPGKAAARLDGVALGAALRQLPARCAEKRIPETPVLHRLLGALAARCQRLRHHAGNPLHSGCAGGR